MGNETGEALARMVCDAAATENQLADYVRVIAEHLDDVVLWLTTPDKREMIYISPAIENVLGCTPQELMDRPALLFERIHPDDRERVQASVRHQDSGDWSDEYRIVHPDGAVRWVRARAFPVPGPRRLIAGVTEDVTSARQAREALACSENRFLSLSDHSGVGIWQIAPDGRTEYVNPAMLDLLELDDTSMLDDHTFHQFFTDASIRRMQDEHGKRAAGRSSSYDIQLVGARGTVRDVIVNGAPLLVDGALQGMIGTFIDVTELRLRERELEDATARAEAHSRRASDWKRRYEAAIEAAQQVFYEWDLDTGRIVWRGLDTALGYGNPDETGTLGWWLSKVHEDDRDRVSALLRGAREPRRTGALDVEYRMVRADGSVARIAQTGRVFDAVDGTRQLIGFLTDVSERRELEEQLQQAMKMEAVGRLAAGVAHDFNNLLIPILGYAQLAQELLPPSLDDDLHEMLEDMASAADAAKQLTTQLLTFGRKQALEIRCLAINQVIRAVEKLLSRALREDIALHLELADDAGNVRADQAQLQQILLNLAVNARDAMPAGGHLRVRTRRLHLRAPDGVLPAGAYLCLEVADDGTGMDEPTRARVFEPFFTTKPDGQGTGLGLATTYAIVRQHGGDVRVTSAPGKGATFSILLPLAEEESAPRQPVPTARPGSGAVILLVDDNELVRKPVARLLTSLGYEVLTAGSPSAAEELARSHGGRIDLLLSDVIMPQVRGPELYQRLVATQPGLRVLFMSGYSADLADAARACGPLLGKPFSVAELSAAVRDALTER